MKIEISLPIFKPMNIVYYENHPRIIQQVVIKGHDILLRLEDIPDLINSDKVLCELTNIELTRKIN